MPLSVRRLAWAVPLLAAACGSNGTPSGGSTKLSTSGFDKSCSTDADCVAVFEGNACDGCGCENAAIARSAEKDYTRYQSMVRGRCTNVPPCSADCAAVTVTCTMGECGASY